MKLLGKALALNAACSLVCCAIISAKFNGLLPSAGNVSVTTGDAFGDGFWKDFPGTERI